MILARIAVLLTRLELALLRRAMARARAGDLPGAMRLRRLHRLLARLDAALERRGT